MIQKLDMIENKADNRIFCKTDSKRYPHIMWENFRLENTGRIEYGQFIKVH